MPPTIIPILVPVAGVVFDGATGSSANRITRGCSVARIGAGQYEVTLEHAVAIDEGLPLFVPGDAPRTCNVAWVGGSVVSINTRDNAGVLTDCSGYFIMCREG